MEMRDNAMRASDERAMRGEIDQNRELLGWVDGKQQVDLALANVRFSEMRRTMIVESSERASVTARLRHATLSEGAPCPVAPDTNNTI